MSSMDVEIRKRERAREKEREKRRKGKTWEKREERKGIEAQRG